jgi:hypothetical protein
MIEHDDEYSGRAPLTRAPVKVESFYCDLTLKQIQKELRKLTSQAHKGISIDEARFDYLLKAQDHNEEYKQMLAEEKQVWRESVHDFAEQCLERTRSFLPVTIFLQSQDDLVELGLSPELAKRLLQRQCLWLTRMSKEEISSLHESDLLGRYNSSAQQMDIIETAAIYASLPESFNSDELGRKMEWRDRMEDNLRRMLIENDNDQLAENRIRNAAYGGLQFGPIEDVTSVRETNIVSGRNSHRPRRSFLEVCKQHSILSSTASAQNVRATEDDSDSDREAFRDRYEEEDDDDIDNNGGDSDDDKASNQGEEDEEVFVVGEGSVKIMAAITPTSKSANAKPPFSAEADPDDVDVGNFGSTEEVEPESQTANGEEVHNEDADAQQEEEEEEDNFDAVAVDDEEPVEGEEDSEESEDMFRSTTGSAAKSPFSASVTKIAITLDSLQPMNLDEVAKALHEEEKEEVEEEEQPDSTSSDYVMLKTRQEATASYINELEAEVADKEV